MRTLLVAINSQFIHSNLAVQALKAACNELCGEVEIVEFSINETLQHIFSGIVRENPDVVAFSCYIWNIELIVKLSDDIKKANPNILILAGGPEVSFDSGGLLKNGVDYLISGEGEEKFSFLLQRLYSGKSPNDEEMLWLQSFTTISCLDSLPSPYQSITQGSMKHKIAYIEASRGCPFHCTYCISSVTQGVRYFSRDKVFEALDILADSGTAIIKFVDRTYNAHERRALEIWDYIRRYEQRNIIFHFEIDPGLLSEKMLDYLVGMPSGLIQIEAGIQSVHPKTLSAVERPWSIDKAFTSLQKVISAGNIHVHVDLIAGLPYESYSHFRESFNQVMDLHAQHYQIGFLKLLRGSAMRENAELYEYKYRDYPPYEIISNRDLSCEELLILKDIEAGVELFYNSGRFVMTLKAIENCLQKKDTFSFYESLCVMMRRKGYLDKPVKAVALYRIMLEFIQENFPVLREKIENTLRFDYLRSFKNPSIPLYLQQEIDTTVKSSKQKKIEQHRDTLERILPRLKKHSLDTIWHQIFIGEFTFPDGMVFPEKAVIAFDFGDIDPVTGLAGAYLLEGLPI